MKTITLTDAEIAMLREAIDSHTYWQLSETNYRRDGNVMEPGSDDPETASEIQQFEALDAKLAELSK
jgi:hypothetical protein